MEIEYLFECENLYLKSVHPFDLKNFYEFKKLIKIGNEYITQKGMKKCGETL